jgi:spore coat protein U-like protein
MLKKMGMGVAAATAVAMMGGSLVTAAELEGLMDVQVEILGACTSVDAPDVLNMGQIAQGGDGSAEDDILVTCGTGVHYAVAIEGGNYDDAGSRRMTNEFDGGTDFIPYVIVSGNCASNTEVGTENVNVAFGYTPIKAYTAGDAMTGIGTGAQQNLTVCAKAVSADTMSVPPGTYVDQVRVVLAF